MKLLIAASLACGILSVAGCSPQIRPSNLDDFPGTAHMTRGPGLFSSQLGKSEGSGTVIYSSKDGDSQNKMQNGGKAVPQTQPQTQFREFEAFRAYQQFLKLPPDAPEKREFQQWLEWKHYRNWKAQQKANGPSD